MSQSKTAKFNNKFDDNEDKSENLELSLKGEDDKIFKVATFPHPAEEFPEKDESVQEESKQTTHQLIKFETEGVISSR